MKTLLRYIIKSILYVIDKDHRENNNIKSDLKKFTNIELVDFESDYGKVTKVFRTVPYQMYRLRTSNFELDCADKHLVFTNNGAKPVDALVVGDLVSTVNGYEEVTLVKDLKYKAHCYCVEVLDDEDERYVTNGIVSHNTTVSAAYILWKTMFTPHTSVLIVGNVFSAAKEVIDRIKFAYEECPYFLKAGIELYNASKIKFDNKSVITARATTSSAGRGLSINLLYCMDGEETVTLRNKETGDITIRKLSDVYDELESQ